LLIVAHPVIGNYFDLLNEAQKQVVFEFLQFWKTFGVG
jgi:hypothetical protein